MKFDIEKLSFGLFELLYSTVGNSSALDSISNTPLYKLSPCSNKSGNFYLMNSSMTVYFGPLA